MRNTSILASLAATLYVFSVAAAHEHPSATSAATAIESIGHDRIGSPIVRSQDSGDWSDPGSWSGGRIPGQGDRVFIAPGHHVNYDVSSEAVIRLLQIAGTLEFARDRDTRLEVGLVKIIANEDLSEEGFDCHGHVQEPSPAAPRPALVVGSISAPIPAEHRAMIRLHHIDGMDPESCPAIVCCGGRMDFHGAPLRSAWTKLARDLRSGEDTIWLADPPVGWRAGDTLLLTRTHRRMKALSSYYQGSPEEIDENEIRTIKNIGPRARSGAQPAKAFDGKQVVETQPAYAATFGHLLELEKPVAYDHSVDGKYRGEVANLSRNVVVESADGDGVRGHTMYHRGSNGSISYAEFRHLGKEGVLGRYPIHFHLLGDTMRGSFVQGASVWDSHNRWIVVHGTSYLTVRDCVGFDSVGHGYFLEDGTEVFNTFDHNLAVLAREGKPLPEQALPFDKNLGAGFWWANCHNVFTNNVAVDCDEYGYRFEAKRTPKFDPVLPILQPDGATKQQDIRTLPFIRFAGNEAHTQRSGGLNLRGISRPKTMIYEKLNQELVKEAREATPDQRHPFWVQDFRAWDCSWAFNSGTGGVFLDGFDAYADDYAIWRSVMDRHVWRNTSFHGILNKDLHMPFSIGLPAADDETQLAYLAAIQGFVDDFPPTTSITEVKVDDDRVIVRGTSVDSTEVRSVTVNGVAALPSSEGFATWEAVLPQGTSKPTTVRAFAEDFYGNVEPRPHEVIVE